MSSGYDNSAIDLEKKNMTKYNVSYDPEEESKKSTITSSSSNLMYLLAVVIAFCVALGVGIGCGVAIGKNQEETVKEPIKGSQEPTSPKVTERPHSTTEAPLPDHWLDLPCMTDQKCPAGISKPPLIIISLDGFRTNFMNRGLTPNIEKLQNCGATAEYMIPSFPTVTFTNHYSMITGLYPESHGIIENSMYDPVMRSTFSISSSNKFNPEWWGGEPLWNTAKKQGLRTATYFWVGSDVEIQEMRPDYWFLYADTEYYSRVDVLVSLLSQPEERRPDFLTLYYDEPDHTGHDPGPDTPEEDEQILRMDGIIGYLMDELMRIGMHECINVIVVADHGMANRTCDQLYVLDDYLDKDDFYTRSTAGTMLRMDPKSSSVVPQDIVDQLKCQHEVAIPYVKWNTPKRWHYMNNVRIEDILVTVPEGWTASDGPSNWCDGGTHGYDNLGPYMRALFAAQGPAFKAGVVSEPFDNIELYELMCEILEITPAPNNGTRGALHHMLKNPVPLTPSVVTDTTNMLACDFPASDETYEQRLTDDTTECTCTQYEETKIKDEYDSRLDSVTDNIDLHAPFGLPVTQFQGDVCELRQQNYFTMYSHDIGAPIYATFTVAKDQLANIGSINSDCLVRPDVRIGADISTFNCTHINNNATDEMTNIEVGYVYPPFFGQNTDEMMDGLITSNTVPQFKGFNADMWREYLWKQVPSWADTSNGINIISGPIYDFDTDGLIDSEEVRENARIGVSLVPTHMFAIFTRCKGGVAMSSACTDLESVAFILPNIDGIYSCESSSVYLENNRATIKDIEKLTGLYFFPNLDEYQHIHLKSKIHSKGALWKDWPMA